MAKVPDKFFYPLPQEAVVSNELEENDHQRLAFFAVWFLIGYRAINR
jgi:hypothetical protein